MTSRDGKLEHGKILQLEETWKVGPQNICLDKEGTFGNDFRIVMISLPKQHAK